MIKPEDLLIGLDGGHSFNTAGKRTPMFPGTNTFMHEWEFNSVVINYLESELDRCGFRTLILSPTDPSESDKSLIDVEEDDKHPYAEAMGADWESIFADVFIDRTNEANAAGADLVVSCHFNANTGIWGSWGGTETYSYPGNANDKRFAEIIHRNVVAEIKLRDRGCKEANFHMLREPKCPAVLIEYGFMDNLEEAKLAMTDAFRKACAVGTAKGICEAFGVTYVPFVEEFNVKKEIEERGTFIVGNSQATKYQMKTFLLNVNPNPKISCDIDTLVSYYLAHGKTENIRGDIAFAQSIHETGYFRFGGQVLPDQNNYAGIGATNNSTVGKGAWFDTPSIGVLAQIQHLKAYGSKENLKTELVDPRFNLVTRGSAIHVEELAQALNPSGVGWAYPGYDKVKYPNVTDAYLNGATYGQSILKILLAILSIEDVPEDECDPYIKELEDKVIALEAEKAELIENINRLNAIRELLGKQLIEVDEKVKRKNKLLEDTANYILEVLKEEEV